MPAALWFVAVLAVAVCAFAAVAGTVTERAWLALPSVLPVAVGLFVESTGTTVTAPDRGWIVALSLAVIALAIVSGGPLVTWVLALTDRAAASGTNNGEEVLRGGATIGYLERLAVVIAVGLGRLEIIAAVIAVKGLGRFTELASSAARERFIIGTLTSLLWAGLAAGVVWLPH